MSEELDQLRNILIDAHEKIDGAIRQVWEMKQATPPASEKPVVEPGLYMMRYQNGQDGLVRTDGRVVDDYRWEDRKWIRSCTPVSCLAAFEKAGKARRVPTEGE